MERIVTFRNRRGGGQPNFLRGLLDTYGAADAQRLPLCTVLTCGGREGWEGGLTL